MKNLRCPRCQRNMKEILTIEDDDGYAERQWQCPKCTEIVTPKFGGDFMRCEIDAHYWADHYPLKHARK